MSLNVTFLIGNGFDRQQGLESSYQSFYKRIKESKKDSTNMIYESIQENHENWSDFEWALGEFTKNELQDKIDEYTINYEESKAHVTEKMVDAFFDDYYEVGDDLMLYLQEEENKISIDEELMLKTTIKTLGSFHNELAPRDRNIINAVVNNFSEANYNFLCFNYTSMVEKFISPSTKENYKFFEHRYGSGVNVPLYVHGTYDNSVILGLDNLSQLNTEIFNQFQLDGLTKFSLIEGTRDLRLDRAKRIILNSNIIIIFGMSFGETDTSWWKEIGNWILKNENNYLILHSFEKNYSTRHPNKVMMTRRKIEDKFLVYMDVEEVKEKLREQIFVIINSKNTFMIKE